MDNIILERSNQEDTSDELKSAMSITKVLLILSLFRVSIRDVRVGKNWVRLAPNGTNLGLFKISFSTFWLAETKCTETDL